MKPLNHCHLKYIVERSLDFDLDSDPRTNFVAWRFAEEACRILNPQEFEGLITFLSCSPQSLDTSLLTSRLSNRLESFYNEEMKLSCKPKGRLGAPGGPADAILGLILHHRSEDYDQLGPFWDLQSPTIRLLNEKGLNGSHVFGYDWHWRAAESWHKNSVCPLRAADLRQLSDLHDEMSRDVLTLLPLPFVVIASACSRKRYQKLHVSTRLNVPVLFENTVGTLKFDLQFTNENQSVKLIRLIVHTCHPAAGFFYNSEDRHRGNIYDAAYNFVLWLTGQPVLNASSFESQYSQGFLMNTMRPPLSQIVQHKRQELLLGHVLPLSDYDPSLLGWITRFLRFNPDLAIAQSVSVLDLTIQQIIRTRLRRTKSRELRKRIEQVTRVQQDNIKSNTKRLKVTSTAESESGRQPANISTSQHVENERAPALSGSVEQGQEAILSVGLMTGGVSRPPPKANRRQSKLRQVHTTYQSKNRTKRLTKTEIKTILEAIPAEEIGQVDEMPGISRAEVEYPRQTSAIKVTNSNSEDRQDCVKKTSEPFTKPSNNTTLDSGKEFSEVLEDRMPERDIHEESSIYPAYDFKKLPIADMPMAIPFDDECGQEDHLFSNTLPAGLDLRSDSDSLVSPLSGTSVYVVGQQLVFPASNLEVSFVVSKTISERLYGLELKVFVTDYTVEIRTADDAVVYRKDVELLFRSISGLDWFFIFHRELEVRYGQDLHTSDNEAKLSAYYHLEELFQKRKGSNKDPELRRKLLVGSIFEISDRLHDRGGVVYIRGIAIYVPENVKKVYLKCHLTTQGRRHPHMCCLDGLVTDADPATRLGIEYSPKGEAEEAEPSTNWLLFKTEKMVMKLNSLVDMLDKRDEELWTAHQPRRWVRRKRDRPVAIYTAWN